MTTEDDFQAKLDADPDDWQTRLVFADWLQERDDPRAEGYRALATIGRRAVICHMTAGAGGSPRPARYIFGSELVTVKEFVVRYAPGMLPPDWFELLPREPKFWPHEPYWKYFATRREGDDAAALAFGDLPADRRAELLSGRTRREPT